MVFWTMPFMWYADFLQGFLGGATTGYGPGLLRTMRSDFVLVTINALAKERPGRYGVSPTRAQLVP